MSFSLGDGFGSDDVAREVFLDRLCRASSQVVDVELGVGWSASGVDVGGVKGDWLTRSMCDASPMVTVVNTMSSYRGRERG